MNVHATEEQVFERDTFWWLTHNVAIDDEDDPGSLHDFFEGSEIQHCTVNSEVRKAITRDLIDFRKEEERVILIGFTVYELTGQDVATTEEIFKRAAEIGLQKCMPEDGLYFRHGRYFLRPGYRIFTGMDPVNDSEGDLKILSINRIAHFTEVTLEKANPDQLHQSNSQEFWIFRF